MQHGHEFCNHLQERKLKCKNSALSVTCVLFGSQRKEPISFHIALTEWYSARYELGV